MTTNNKFKLMRTAFLLLIFFTLVSCNPMMIRSKSLSTRYVSALQGDSVINTSILLKNDLPSPDFDVDYYWYNNGKVLITQGSGAGKLLHGEYQVQDALTGKLITKGYLKNGLKTGIWISWYENERLRETSEWKKGLRNGTTKIFDIKGNLVTEIDYRHGLKKTESEKFKFLKLPKRQITPTPAME